MLKYPKITFLKLYNIPRIGPANSILHILLSMLIAKVSIVFMPFIIYPEAELKR